MNELSELRTQLLARFDRGISFLLDHHLPSREADAATLICDQAARRLLRDGTVDESHWSQAVHQSWSDCVDDYYADTGTTLPNTTKHRSSREVIDLLEELQDLDRQVVLRYFRSGQEKSAICCALELSDYHFNQILARVKHRYAAHPSEQPADLSVAINPYGDRLDRYLVNQSTEQESKQIEMALLEQPAIIREAQLTKNLILDLRQAHLPRRWRLEGEPRREEVKGRLKRRRRGLWRFLTRPCLGAAASVLCVIGIFGSWVMWDMQRVNMVMTEASGPSIVPLRVAQTRGSQPSAFLALPSAASVVSVSLDIGTPQNGNYRVRLEDASGKMLWQQLDVTPARDELLHFLVDGEILASGVHRFLVEPGDGPGHRIQLAFQVDTQTLPSPE